MMGLNLATYWYQKPKSLVIIWLIAAALIGILGFFLGTKTVIPGPANLNTLLSNPGEKAAILAGLPPKDSLVSVISHENLDYDTNAAIAARATFVTLLKELHYGSDKSPVFVRIETPDNTFLDQDSFISNDKKSVLIKAHSNHSIDQSAEEFKQLEQVFQKWQAQHSDFSLNYLSYGTVNNEMFALINKDLDRSLIYSVPLTFLILLWAFGSLVAAFVPLVIAGISLVTSLGLAALISNFSEPVSATANQLVVLLVLAIGIDYSLFFITRFREELQKSNDYLTAINKTRQTTGMAIFWSGLIVALSLCGLLLMQDSILASMSLVAIIAVIITLFNALYILPAFLLILNKRIELGSIKKKVAKTTVPKWLKFTVKHPLLVVTTSSLSLLILGSFALNMKLGSTVEPEVLPRSLQSYQAFSTMRKKFADLVGSDFSIIMQSKKLAELEANGQLDEFFEKLFLHEHVRGPIRVERTKSGHIARYKYLGLGDTNHPDNQALIYDLRNNLIPNILEPLGITAHTAGTLTYVYDTTNLYSKRTPVVFIVVLILCFLFLLVAFRSLVVPLKAIILNLLSTFAAFGVLVLFFQHNFIPEWNFHVIESFVPALLFAILFGLSMDYHVFLLARIAEESKTHPDTRLAVEQGIINTFKSITSAAFIMVAVFAIVATLEFPIMKELGLGLAFAVFIDATLIRCFLLPASMLLLGRWNWYLPKSLKWLPVIKLD